MSSGMLISASATKYKMAWCYIKSLLFTSTGDRSGGDYQRVLERGSDSGSELDEKESLSDEQSRCHVNPRIISDAIIGLSDGLTVPFALTAGLSALGEADVVVYGGLAELIAGGISMGLGGYLGARSESEAYNAKLSETQLIVSSHHEKAASMLRSTFEQYRFPAQTLDSMTTSLAEDPDQMVDFLMRFHHQLAESDFTASRAYVSGLTISAGYFFGGLIPLTPYLFFAHIQQAFVCSVLVMALALFTFGWMKTALVGESSRWTCFQNAVQMTVLGGVAAGAAMGCVKAIGG